MTAREKLKREHPEYFKNGFPITCPNRLNYLPIPDYCGDINNEPLTEDDDIKCAKCWDREIPEEKELKIAVDPKEIAEAHKHYVEGKISMNELREIMGFPKMEELSTPRILDSGNRRQFESGAVRDIQEGKGRCDLLPLDVVSEYLDRATNSGYNTIIARIDRFINTGKMHYLYHALATFTEQHWEDDHTMLLEVAKHFEEGCKKYGENNWQKGIPVHCYIDSGVRHYLKFLRGDTDEPHDRAFCWNIMCAIWTCKHKPELNEYAKNTEEPV